MKTRTKQGFTLIELLVVITIIALLASIAMPVFSQMNEKGQITKGISNCKQVVLAERIFASDNGGAFSDQIPAASAGAAPVVAADSISAFQQLVNANYVNDDRIFGCPLSGTAKTSIGQVSSTVKLSNDNHWSIITNLSDSGAASPLILENALTPSATAPAWDVNSVDKLVPGRPWSGPSIIIGLSDGSVAKYKLNTSGALNPIGSPFPSASSSAAASGSNAPTMLAVGTTAQ